MKKEVKIYPRVIERIEDWPIYLLSKDRQNFVAEIDEETTSRILQKHKNDVSDLLVKTIYQERIRIKESPWKVDPPNERSFWNRISNKLIKKSLDRDDPESKAVNEEILHKIIHRYSEEIVGTFQIRTFKFAQRFLTAFFNRIFNAVVGKSISAMFRGKRNLYERLNIVGDVDTVRELFKHGTVVVLPTHSSNLDSILVGYAMDQIMGLPSFSYGAGLNLYNFGPAAYYMNRLGAYRVDRRKKNAIYLETLKTMSRLSIQRGVNSLFFPGGTRSRSGEIEKDLKLGLLGTAVEAQRAIALGGSDKKVFLVPMVICYNSVLEAPFLIEQHLRITGKENYIRLKDEGTSVRGWFRFIWRFITTSSDITLSVGKPMDVLGNFVDSNGRSFDKNNNEIDVREYYIANSGINEDRQRENEYTKLLADKLVERYQVENVVFSSHLVATAVFQMLLHENPKLDIFGILRLPTDEYIFPRKNVKEVIEQMKNRLLDMEKEGKIRLDADIYEDSEHILKKGVWNLGIFHTVKPLRLTKQGDIYATSFRVLYFYHNRLVHYNLSKFVQWKGTEIEALKIVDD
ncbi:MAG: 1-acyl-sn-glycerol-3-phosphate acyltransferase [Saprospiraceae bacterium]|nr:1-acyl-sn-glycerol-3-phosphate acyltransferase [Saprospiraceae bacterium]MCB9343746.1 1-acyl-sn-glycerol-3-phosphate acyltransferase [Lewinellaceae bacterium]